MTEPTEAEKEQAAQRLTEFVVERMQGGVASSAIVEELAAQGVEQQAALELVGSIHAQLSEALEAQRFSVSALSPALALGTAAALVGGILWAVIIVTTDYELGILAWGIGGACGIAVAWGARGSRGLPFQLAAVGTSALGILTGKYFAFAYYVRLGAVEGGHVADVSEVPYVSLGMIGLFIENLGEMLTPYDALWAFLAISTAWKIPAMVKMQLKA